MPREALTTRRDAKPRGSCRSSDGGSGAVRAGTAEGSTARGVTTNGGAPRCGQTINCEPDDGTPRGAAAIGSAGRGSSPVTVEGTRLRSEATVGSADRGSSPVTVEGARLRCEAAFADGLSVAIACDPSLEGILGAVGIGYLAHADEAHIRLVPRDGAQPRLGEGLVEAPGDADDQMVSLARRVYRGFKRHVSEGCPKLRGGSCPSGCAGACSRKIVYAAASDEPGTAEAIHSYVRRGFREGGRMRSLIADAQVVEVDELARGVLGECEHTRQFVRFSQLADGSLWSVFRPKADTIPLTAGFFARRMGNERFCIVDPVHRSAAFHDSGQLSGRKGYAVIRIDREGAERLASSHELSPDERYVRALWKRFYDSVALPGRDASQRGYDLRAGWMPKRFWAGLTELDPTADDAGTSIPKRYEAADSPSLLEHAHL